MADPKKKLREFIAEQKKRKADEDNERKRRLDDDRSAILQNVGSDLAESLRPVLPELAKSAQISEETIRKALSDGLQVNMPKFDTESLGSRLEQAVYNAIGGAFADLKFPTPVINVPPAQVNMPEIRIPETKFPDKMDVGLGNYSNKTPMPVIMMDAKGKPFQFSFPSGGGGGKTDFLTIKGFSQSAYSELMNADGRLRVSVETGGSGLTDAELRASHLDVQQVSGAIDSVYVTGVAASVYAEIMNPDGRVKVELPTGSSGLTDTELRATSVPVEQVSGSIWSTSVSGSITSTGAYLTDGDGNYRGTVPVEATNLDIRDLANASDSVSAYQVSGAIWSTAVGTSATAGDGATNNVVSPQGFNVAAGTAGHMGVLLYAFNGTNTDRLRNTSGESNALRVQMATNAVASVYVTGSSGTTVIVGPIVADAAANGDAPVKVGGIARTANPTAVANADMVSATFDDLGRQVIRNVQVRDLIQTAYVSVTNGTETTLRAGVAGAYLDLVMLVASNNSDAAVSVDIRPVTAGNIVNTLRIPANGTAGWTPAVPWPQTDTGNNWTVDGPDETGRTLTFSALFSQEI